MGNMLKHGLEVERAALERRPWLLLQDAVALHTFLPLEGDGAHQRLQTLGALLVDHEQVGGELLAQVVAHALAQVHVVVRVDADVQRHGRYHHANRIEVHFGGRKRR